MKSKFSSEDLVSYLEEKIINNEHTDSEMNLYIDYKTYGEFNKNNTYKKLIREMKEWHEGDY